MNRCRGCLKEIHRNDYCNSCLRKLFNGKVPVLNLKKSDFQTVRYELIDHFSISGVQDKISLKLVGNELCPTSENGEFILKPVPEIQVPQFQIDIPANEHLTMQIARQIFQIKTAENALIYFQDGDTAYITKRFDRLNGEKLRQEDFCQLMEKSPETHGENFKYNGTYQQIGNIINRICAAGKIQIEKLFKLILFNYILGNGDAHLKNFSLVETQHADFVLSPAYDIINTNIHFPNETRIALEMFDDFESEFYRENGFYGKADFLKLAEFYEIRGSRAKRMIEEFSLKKAETQQLIEASFLSKKAKIEYHQIFEDRLKAISIE